MLNLVSQDNPEKLEARYGNLLTVIVKAIQEESAEKDKKLNDQAKEIKALKEKLNLFEKRLNQLFVKKQY
jgi:ubiquinone biosynthesis protein UbiJ